MCVKTIEPILLVGETGCGKTTVIQTLADRLGQELVVQNLNIQSDSSELLGGYKPVELREIARPLYHEFLDLFQDTFDIMKNAKFLNIMTRGFENQNWSKIIRGFTQGIKMSQLFFSNQTKTDTKVKVIFHMIWIRTMGKRWQQCQKTGKLMQNP